MNKTEMRIARRLYKEGDRIEVVADKILKYRHLVEHYLLEGEVKEEVL